MERTHWKKQFNYDYLGSYSLPDGKDIVLTIRETRKEDVIGASGKKENCFVAYFVEDVKPMILNRTNCKTLEKLCKTPFIEEWSGKAIQIGSAKVSAFGDTVDALRVRNILPKADNRAEVRTNSMQWAGIIDAAKKGYKIEQITSKYKLTSQQIKLIENEITGSKGI